MEKDLSFDEKAVCGECGKIGAYVLQLGSLCPECLKKHAVKSERQCGGFLWKLNSVLAEFYEERGE